MLEGNLEATRELLFAPGIDVEARDEQVSNPTKVFNALGCRLSDCPSMFRNQNANDKLGWAIN